MSAVKIFIDANISIARLINRCLPRDATIDGNTYFLERILPEALKPNRIIYDIGGGSRPCISREQKERIGAKVIGVDISEKELKAAPPGVYDKVIVADICELRGNGDADVVICQALLEHVPNARGAIKALASCAKPGGRVYIFAPCRNALFARINFSLPQAAKNRLLRSTFDYASEGHDGFVAYYDQCAPSQVAKIARDNGLLIEYEKTFWKSGYFNIFVPAYVFWRLYQVVARMLIGGDAAESFAFVLRREENVNIQ